jgi:hypothetical protein
MTGSLETRKKKRKKKKKKKKKKSRMFWGVKLIGICFSYPLPLTTAKASPVIMLSSTCAAAAALRAVRVSHQISMLTLAG